MAFVSFVTSAQLLAAVRSNRLHAVSSFRLGRLPVIAFRIQNIEFATVSCLQLGPPDVCIQYDPPAVYVRATGVTDGFKIGCETPAEAIVIGEAFKARIATQYGRLFSDESNGIAAG